MRIYIVIYLTLSLLLTGCKDDNIEEVQFQLKDFCSSFIESSDFEIYSTTPLHSCIIEYTNGRVLKVIHKKAIGFSINPEGSMETPKDFYDEFSYSVNKITLTRKSDAVNFRTGIIEYTLDSNGKILKKIFPQSKDTTYFEYSENGLLKKSVSRFKLNNSLTKEYTFDSNRNLQKVIGKLVNGYDITYTTYEYFSGYDNSINGFKNIGFISGAFIRSLSENNYSTYTYEIRDDNDIVIYSREQTFNIKYDKENHPIYGDCNF